MDENVAKAVESVSRSLQANYMPPAPVHVDLQTIRARLVELEAENERLREFCALCAVDKRRVDDRLEKAEALLREISGALSNGDGELAVLDRITAHLQEQEKVAETDYKQISELLAKQIEGVRKELREYVNAEAVMIAAGLVSKEKVEQAHLIVRNFE